MKTPSLALLVALVCLLPFTATALSRRSLDSDWRFAFGHIDPARDFGCGTEYFNYLTKANSIHNEGPYSPKFNDSTWVGVTLPHDFVVDLPYASDASHSHGYKQVGYKYPATSVGWYRRWIPTDDIAEGERVYVAFDGIFRDSRVWLNGFYLGGEPSGYATQRYDITPYIKRGEPALLTVRSDATLEEGWFYEGGGIYRHVWLETAPAIHVKPSTLRVSYDTREREFGTQKPLIDLSGIVHNASAGNVEQGIIVKIELLELDGTPAGGKAVSGVNVTSISLPGGIAAKGDAPWHTVLHADSALRLWSPDSPNLYDVRVTLHGAAGRPDTTVVRTGFRDIAFDASRGLLVNGAPVKIHGVNQHQDHAGVGSGILDAVNIYRLKELKKYGVNAVRSSHNPMTPEVLAACDSLGILVVEENRLLGINDYHLGQLKTMIDRDFNHPSIILWSVGNEEWGVEWDPRGTSIVTELRDFTHRLDPTRLMTVATSSGPTVVETSDVAGYNYVMQNPIDQAREAHPERLAFGSEETTGCGTRGIYYDDRENGRMASMNRTPDVEHDSVLNRIARGWKFYRERPWLAGLCYWTGFDYRGEPNPLQYPATGSQFGLLDYCGFPKDEAYYLKSQLIDEPVLHVFPHWNLAGHEGEEVDVWAYSNLDEVELSVSGKSLGRCRPDTMGYFSWKAVYHPGKIVAKGYKGGKRVMTRTIETTGTAVKARPYVAYTDGSVSIVNVDLLDSKGRIVPDACPMLTLGLPDGSALLGAGNGDSAMREKERPLPGESGDGFTFPAFNGHAQFIITGTSLPEVSIN